MAITTLVTVFFVVVAVFVAIMIWDTVSPSVCPRCHGTGFDPRDGLECLNCNML